MQTTTKNTKRKDNFATDIDSTSILKTSNLDPSIFYGA